MWGVLRSKTKSFFDKVRPFCEQAVFQAREFFDFSYTYLELSILNIIFSYIVSRNHNEFLNIKIYYDNEWRVITLPSTRSDALTFTVYDSVNKNVTTDLVSKGLMQNFFGIPTSPLMLGYSSLKFVDYDDNEKTFKGESIINIYFFGNTNE